MINVNITASRNYEVIIGVDLVSTIGERIAGLHPKIRKVAVVTDDNVKRIYLESVVESIRGANFLVEVFSVMPGESAKSGETFLSLLNWLAEKQFTRSDVIAALGGGVVGDLAGFAAASYRRGVPFVQIPTTLLAMVDSSVGGKVAINLSSGKNLAGAFYQPSIVICDTSTIGTLPKDVFSNGMAEIIKYGMLGCAELLEELLGSDDDINTITEETIARCVSMKRDIVARDEFDTGERMLLNFGHTIGHAIERLSDYKIPHGHAIAIGMAIDTRAAAQSGLCPPECEEFLTGLLECYGLPERTNYNAEELFNAAMHDKKRMGEEIVNVVPREIGKCELITISVDDMLSWIETGLSF